MKYIELIFLTTLVLLFSSFMSGQIKNYSNLINKNNDYLTKKNANEFIFESFKNTCEGRGFSSLYQWQQVCKEMWKLDYIGWSDAREVMLINNNIKGPVLYGAWIGKNYEGQVYWKEH